MASSSREAPGLLVGRCSVRPAGCLARLCGARASWQRRGTQPRSAPQHRRWRLRPARQPWRCTLPLALQGCNLGASCSMNGPACVRCWCVPCSKALPRPGGGRPPGDLRGHCVIALAVRHGVAELLERAPLKLCSLHEALLQAHRRSYLSALGVSPATGCCSNGHAAVHSHLLWTRRPVLQLRAAHAAVPCLTMPTRVSCARHAHLQDPRATGGAHAYVTSQPGCGRVKPQCLRRQVKGGAVRATLTLVQAAEAVLRGALEPALATQSENDQTADLQASPC